MHVSWRNAPRTTYHRVSDLDLFLRHAIVGRSYTRFHASLMDRRIRRRPDWGLSRPKEFQLEYLVRHGLKPDSQLLDYGCGALVAGRWFIAYLDAGHYVGADIAADVLAEGRRRILAWGLVTKKPLVIYLRDGGLDALEERAFDIVWAQSVLTHMPASDAERLLVVLHPRLRSGGRIFANFATRKISRPRRTGLRDWHYFQENILELAHNTGYRARIMRDWRHPAASPEDDSMVEFRPLGQHSHISKHW
jgi:SAM-dependent methyltransferase